MERQWTRDQLNAIDARGGCVIVSAAAGSGKTAVLVERCIRLLTDPDPARRVDADRLLVVTYTRAAAAELKERLSKAITKLVRSSPDDPDLVRQQRLLSKAHISTVDSFCSSLAREYFYLLDIDRDFRVADDGELNVLTADAMRMTLDMMYTEGSSGFHKIVETFASAKDDAKLENHILRLYHFVRSHPFPERWMREKLDYYTDFTDVSTSVWGRIIRDYTMDAVDYMARLHDRMVDALSSDEKLMSANAALCESDRAYLERLSGAVSSQRWDAICEAAASFVSGRFSTPRGYADNPLKVAAAASREIFRKTAGELKSIYAQGELMCLYDIELLKDCTEQLFRAVTLFGENYSALKRERGFADYPDLEHWTIDLLVDPVTLMRTPVAEEVASRFDYIMVDEYQDANETQDTIFKALSDEERNLFVVGDVKQSIYGFRHAMPELFITRKDNAALYREDDPVFPAKIILGKNFRSASGVLAAVNDIFTRLMSPSVGDIDYNAEERLYYGADYAATDDAPAEFDMIDCKSAADDSAVMTEARFIAERIHQIVFEGYPVKDGDGYRPIEYGDFAVLLRSFSASAPIYTDVLSGSGIAVSTESSGGFLAAREIMLMTNLLRVINNPALDIELLSVLMSPIYGFDEDDLARIRAGRPQGTLYAALIADADRGERRSRAFLDELSSYRALSVTVTVSKLIGLIDARSSCMNILIAADRTGTARNNLRMLTDYARGYEQHTHKGLGGFVAYLDRLTENGSDLPSAPRDKSAAVSGVRVMSIHASKGLEFPVVILADTTHRFVSDASKAVLLHPRYGYAQKRWDPALSASYNTMPRKALALEISRDEKSEELRVLYVALTRAKQKLIMVSAPTQGAEKYLASISKKLAGERTIPPYAVRSVSSLSDWLTMCAMLHPDASELREYAEMEVDHDRKADYRLDCRIIRPTGEAEAVSGDEAQEISAANPAVIEALRRHAAFVYPYEELLKLPSKVAASALAHKESGAGERYLNRPAFLGATALNAAERGTAMHLFMQFADYRAAREDIGAEITRLRDGGYLTAAQAQSISTERAGIFVHSALIDRVMRAERVYKEYRFTVRIPAGRVDPQIGGRFADESVILQGAVDLAFEEDGELVIVDYKTDRVRHPRELEERYHTQLELYRDAMEQCLGISVKQCIIYSVYHNEEIILPIDKR